MAYGDTRVVSDADRESFDRAFNVIQILQTSQSLMNLDPQSDRQRAISAAMKIIIARLEADAPKG